MSRDEPTERANGANTLLSAFSEWMRVAEATAPWPPPPRGAETIVVDISTTGTDLSTHVPVEIAWWSEHDDAPCSFVAPYTDEDIANASPRALEVIQFDCRPTGKALRHKPRDDGTILRAFHWLLTDMVLARWDYHDTAMLNRLFLRHGLEENPWSWELDLQIYVSGYLGLSPSEPYLRLSTAREELGVAPRDHTALGDVRTAGECLRAIRRAGDERRRRSAKC